MISNKESMQVKKQNGLQRLTESKVEAPNDQEIRINNLLKKQRITKSDLETWEVNDKDKLCQILTDKMNTLTGVEAEEFIEKIEDIIDDGTKRQLWENNHYTITQTINRLINDLNRMPTKTEISKNCGISRPTIYKHLTEYSSHPNYAFELEQHRILGTKVLTKMYQHAMDGDVKAAKVYLQATGWLNGSSPKVNIGNQNNYVQMNGVIINEETLKQLPPEQLLILKNMLKDLRVSE